MLLELNLYLDGRLQTSYSDRGLLKNLPTLPDQSSDCYNLLPLIEGITEAVGLSKMELVEVGNFIVTK